MINLAGAQAAAVDQQFIFCVRAYSGCGFSCNVCTATCWDTGPRGCGYSIGCGDSLVYFQAVDPAQQLSALKTQLKQALADIEKQESALQPQTVAQVEEQEGKLQEKLASLAQRKKELGKK
jgi:hypothetical protein